MEKTMDCNPEPAKETIEQSGFAAKACVPAHSEGENELMLPVEEAEIVDATPDDAQAPDNPQSLDRHNFQGLELDLQLKEMNLKFKTHQSLEPQVYALMGQLNALQAELQQHQDKLAVANRTVGFLEAQVRVQQTQIDELRALSLTERASEPKSNLFVKLLGMITTRR